MTGIDRLRTLAGAWDEWGLGGTLAEMADQIERELREERDRWDSELCEAQMDKSRVIAVYLEMNKHSLGHGGMEDSPVARWARELRGALKSDASDGSEAQSPSCADADGAADATSEAPKVTREDAEAIAWVRERGGLEAVEARLMPEGYEWPRYDTGEPVMFGDCVENRHGTCTVKSVRFYSGGGVTVYGEDSGAQFVVITEPVMREPIKRAKHQVLAADGEPLEVGQTVWHVATGREYTVRSCTSGGAHLSSDGKPAGYCRAEYLTHQRPVLGADGVPIREGDTVWLVSGGEPAEVAYTIDADASHPDEVVLKGYEDDWPVNADKLTHTKPEQQNARFGTRIVAAIHREITGGDSWERVEEDVDALVDAEINGEGSYNAANAYCNRRGLGEGTSFVLMAQDLMRRCKALAERERGE